MRSPRPRSSLSRPLLPRAAMPCPRYWTRSAIFAGASLSPREMANVERPARRHGEQRAEILRRLVDLGGALEADIGGDALGHRRGGRPRIAGVGMMPLATLTALRSGLAA